MNEADHAELSRRLALAIGWPRQNVHITHGECFIWLGRDGREFDYRDPEVIWPIAERYNCFPARAAWRGGWCASVDDALPMLFAATAAEAVARAVVGAQQC